MVAGPPWGSLLHTRSMHLRSALTGSLPAILAAGTGRAQSGDLCFPPHTAPCPSPHPDTGLGSKAAGDGWSTGKLRPSFSPPCLHDSLCNPNRFLTLSGLPLPALYNGDAWVHGGQGGGGEIGDRGVGRGGGGCSSASSSISDIPLIWVLGRASFDAN